MSNNTKKEREQDTTGADELQDLTAEQAEQVQGELVKGAFVMRVNKASPKLF